MSKPILVLGDIHHRHEWAEECSAQIPHSHRIILGDAFDQFDDCTKDAEAAARWVKRVLWSEKDTLILGNHDMHYQAPGGKKYRGSGYGDEKMDAINRILSPSDWRRFRVCAFVQGWWLSHAGVGQLRLVPSNGNPNRLIERMQTEYRLANTGKKGQRRMELYRAIWTHWDYFQPLRHVNQIVGHSPGREPRSRFLIGDRAEEGLPNDQVKHLQIEHGYDLAGTWCGSVPADIETYSASVNWCLDTHSAHVGLLEDGKLTVIESPVKPPAPPHPRARGLDLATLMRLCMTDAGR